MDQQIALDQEAMVEVSIPDCRFSSPLKKVQLAPAKAVLEN
jgi:hypothetical protein